MPSSLNQPMSESGLSGGSGFGFGWRSDKGSGPETVITNPRGGPAPGSSPEIAIFEKDLVGRLFPTTHDAEHVAGITIGHFTIQKRIGMGGMGSVFLASDERLKREVALKVLAPSLALESTSVQRFQNEAQAAARLDHDNIARVFSSGEESGLHFIAYEYVPGQNLRDLIRSKGWLEPAEAVNYAIQLTAALHHSSSAGVIHRDIKPSNVLITPFGRAKLVDLGLARKTSLGTSFELTIPGTTLGTFDYISPEQARDPHSVDVRSDIYSLGCTLYHMLTGEPPYPEGTVLQKLLDHPDKEPPDPAKKNRRVSPMLSHVVRKMMASLPARRHASPGDLLRDLLIVARSLGAGAVPIDGQVWLTATRFKPPFWQSNFGWVATTCALCLLVACVQFYPSLTRNPYAPAPIVTKEFIPNPEPFTPDVAVTEPVVRKTVPRTEPEAPPKRSISPEVSVVNSSPLFSNLKNEFNTTDPRPTSAVPVPIVIPSTTNEVPAFSDKPAAVPDPSVPAIQIVNGKSYVSLEAACTEAAENGSIIELSYNGLREPERPIRLPNKKLIIRAGEGFRPTIRFAPGDFVADGAQPHMITVAGGLLELVNVDVIMEVPNRAGTDRWALFSLERPEKVQLTGVTLTLKNLYNKSACLFEQRAPVGQGLDGMGVRKTGMPVVPPELLLSESFVRGAGDFIVLRDPVPARFEIKDSVIGVEGNLLQLKLVMESLGMERESISLELEHVTCLLGQSLLSVEGMGGITERLPPLFLNARNNVISCGPGRPLISLRGLAEYMDFQQSFSWKGDLNFYNDIETFLEISTAQLTGNQNLDHAQWRLHWGTNEGVRSINLQVLKSPGKSFSSLTEADVLLSTESNPAVKGASDGYAAGAPIRKLPPIDQ